MLNIFKKNMSVPKH